MAHGALLFSLIAQAVGSSHMRQHGTRSLIQDMYDVVDPRVTCYSYEAWSLWLLGFPDQAVRASTQAISLAQEIDHPFSMALAHCFGAWLHQFLHAPAQVLAHAEAAIAISLAQEFPFWLGWARVMRGWAWAERGDVAASLQEMQSGLIAWRAQGSDLGRGYFLSLMAETCCQAGQAVEGLSILDEAETFAAETGERWWEPERYRLRGELILRRAADVIPPDEEAETWFQQALESARGLGARSLALRAAMSLYRLRQPRGGSPMEEARTILAEECAHFTEGRDTHDVQAAHALLDSQEPVPSPLEKS